MKSVIIMLNKGGSMRDMLLLPMRGVGWEPRAMFMNQATVKRY